MPHNSQVTNLKLEKEKEMLTKAAMNWFESIAADIEHIAFKLKDLIGNPWITFSFNAPTNFFQINIQLEILIKVNVFLFERWKLANFLTSPKKFKISYKATSLQIKKLN